MNTRRQLSEIIHGAGRPIGHPQTRQQLARLLAAVAHDATPSQRDEWARELATEAIDAAEAARWLDAIRTRKPRSPGAYYNACRKNAKRRTA